MEENKNEIEELTPVDEQPQEVTETPVEETPTVEEVNTVEEKITEAPVEEKKEEKQKKKGKGLLVVIVLLLVIILGGAGAAFFLLPKNESTSVKNDAKEVKSVYRMSGNGLEYFDLQFLKLENEAKNKVYSPLSIKYALAMLSEGAKGTTKNQIDAIIGDYKANKYPNNEHMSFANAMFVRNTYKEKVKKTYTDNLTNKFNAEVVYDEFANPDNINKWVSDKTFNLINNLVDDVSSNDFFLINALAIDMNWNNQIHCEGVHKIPCVNDGMYSIDYAHEKLGDDEYGYSVTEYPYSLEDNFYQSYKDGQIVGNKFNNLDYVKGATVLADFNKYDIIKDLGEDKIREMLRPEYEAWLKTDEGKDDLPVEQGLDRFIKELKENYGKKANSTDFLVHEDGDVKVFAKDLQEYDGSTLQYVGIMPKKVELTEFVKDTDKDKINNIIKELKEVNIDSFEEGYATRIRGFIPFFKFEYELNLMKDLKSMGVADVFDSKKSDLTNLSDGAAINKAIHKANIEFSNDGIKASASTAMGGYGSASGPAFEHLFKVPVKEIDVTFDKPYMYLIRDKKTGEVWFVGTVYEPITR